MAYNIYFFLLLNLIKEGSFYFIKKIYLFHKKNKVHFLNSFVSKKFFFLSGFPFTTIHESNDCRGRGMASPHYHFHPLHRHLDISQVITAGSSPLHIAAGPKLGTFGFCTKLVTTKLCAPRRFIFRISFQFQKL